MESDHNVSSTTTTITTITQRNAILTKLIDIKKLKHFAVKYQAPVNDLARMNQDSIIIHPATYFCLETTFTLPPFDYIVALICNVSVENHGMEKCQLLNSIFGPCEYTYALVLTNKSNVHIIIPDFYDLRCLIDTPFITVEICHLDLSALCNQ
jgi:hypothetical protein